MRAATSTSLRSKAFTRPFAPACWPPNIWSRRDHRRASMRAGAPRRGGQRGGRGRHFNPGFKRGLWFGMANSALEVVTGGRTPWTLKIEPADYKRLEQLDQYESPDRGWGERTLPPRDRLASGFLASTTHAQAQPAAPHN